MNLEKVVAFLLQITYSVLLLHPSVLKQIEANETEKHFSDGKEIFKNNVRVFYIRPRETVYENVKELKLLQDRNSKLEASNSTVVAVPEVKANNETNNPGNGNATLDNSVQVYASNSSASLLNVSSNADDKNSDAINRNRMPSESDSSNLPQIMKRKKIRKSSRKHTKDSKARSNLQRITTHDVDSFERDDADNSSTIHTTNANHEISTPSFEDSSSPHTIAAKTFTDSASSETFTALPITTSLPDSANSDADLISVTNTFLGRRATPETLTVLLNTEIFQDNSSFENATTGIERSKKPFAKNPIELDIINETKTSIDQKVIKFFLANVTSSNNESFVYINVSKSEMKILLPLHNGSFSIYDIENEVVRSGIFQNISFVRELMAGNISVCDFVKLCFKLHGLKIAAVLGVVALLILILLIVCYLRRRRKKAKYSTPAPPLKNKSEYKIIKHGKVSTKAETTSRSSSDELSPRTILKKKARKSLKMVDNMMGHTGKVGDEKRQRQRLLAGTSDEEESKHDARTRKRRKNRLPMSYSDEDEREREYGRKGGAKERKRRGESSDDERVEEESKRPKLRRLSRWMHNVFRSPRRKTTDEESALGKDSTTPSPSSSREVDKTYTTKRQRVMTFISPRRRKKVKRFRKKEQQKRYAPSVQILVSDSEFSTEDAQPASDTKELKTRIVTTGDSKKIDDMLIGDEWDRSFFAAHELVTISERGERLQDHEPEQRRKLNLPRMEESQAKMMGTLSEDISIQSLENVIGKSLNKAESAASSPRAVGKYQLQK